MIATGATIFGHTLKSAQPLACRLLEAAVSRGKLANAYLLVGRANEDKLELVRQIACQFNCQAADRDTSGSCLARGNKEISSFCLNCQWISKCEHPQAWLSLDGEGKSGKIPVEKARLITEELGKTSPFVRIVVVPEAGEASFHRPAANALLKSIEEPPPDVLFFFFADSVESVLATIVSRCQVLPLNRPLSLSYWASAQADGKPLSAELLAKLDAARADFIVQARRHFDGAAHSHQYFKTVSEGLGLSSRLQELCKELEEEMEEAQAGQEVLDLFMASEMEALKQMNADDRGLPYTRKLLELVEISKQQIRQYVKRTNALESFSLSLVDLRQAYSGEISLAKR
ncbi:MAG TPA: hypothetical protein V6D22_21780 [Candidatus Obscuribacterales bacterium]